MKDLELLKFATEAEEAEWWDVHMDIVEENLTEAIRNGTARHGTALMLSEAFQSPTLIVRLTGDNAVRIRKRAAEQGQEESVYVSRLLHKALEREE